MVTTPKASKTTKSIGFGLWLLLAAQGAIAQDGDAYRIVVRMGGGAQPLMGFLYAVNDTAIQILPSARLTPNDLRSKLETSVPVSIPIRVIKKVKLTKVRSLGHDFGVATLFAIIYAAGYVLVLPLNNPIDLIPYTLVTGTLTVATMDLIYSRKYRPNRPGFMMMMQKYCLKNNGLVVDR